MGTDAPEIPVGLVRAGACKIRAPNCGKLSDATLRICLTTASRKRNCASMWFKKRKTTPSLSEELVQRVWDLSGHLKQLEGNLEERLDELAKRYRRAEQSEKRLDDKKASSPCDDAEQERRVHPALRDRQKRRQAQNNRLKEHA